MASPSNLPNITHSSGRTLISFNATQFPLKLTQENYPAWRAQVVPILNGHNLMGYVDQSLKCPSLIVCTNDKDEVNKDYEVWICQDQLILAAIIAAISFSAMHIVSSTESFADAWEKIQKSCANKSATRILSLKDKLANFKRESRSIFEYLQMVNAISEDLALSRNPISDVDLVVRVLNGVGPEYCDIAAIVRAHDTIISFEELQDKLQAHELYLKTVDPSFDSSPITANVAQKGTHVRQNSKGQNQGISTKSINYGGNQNSSENITRYCRGSSGSRVICQICERPGYIAKQCFGAKDYFKDNFPMPRAHHAATPKSSELDS
ncbi:uncharacterized protein LOC119370876 [Jatropha curcas]|uniref:uncharacterized protein LOC119370876 n=1 Tax=Jatropha curcas TaxID=180498 RepID=UPI001895E94B|nr:uncharacterized protein LOC119370876 [Jatropha curcas]